MIITAYGLIIFHLVVWIGVRHEKQPWTATDCKDMFGFAYQAKPSRHEIPGKTFHAVLN